MASISFKIIPKQFFYLYIFQAGPVESVRRPKDSNGRPKAFAFIVYKHECSVPYALELFRGTKLYNSLLFLNCRNRISNIPVLESNSNNNKRHSYPKSASKKTSNQCEMRYGPNLRLIEKNELYYPRNSTKRPKKEVLSFNISNCPLTQDGLNVSGANVTLHSMMDRIYGPRKTEHYPQQNLQCNNNVPSSNHHWTMMGPSSHERYTSTPPTRPYNARRHSDWGSYYSYPTPTYNHNQHQFPHRY